MNRKLLLAMTLLPMVSLMCLLFPTFNRNLQKEQRVAWLDNWAKTPKCLAPCWEGMTIGDTLLNDVPSKLKEVNGFSQLLRTEDIYLGQNCSEWSMKGSESNIAFGVVCSDKTKRPEVQQIDLHFARLTSKPVIISEINNLYGPPAKIRLNWGMACDIQFYYPKFGMFVFSAGFYGDGITKVAEDLGVTRILLVDPNKDIIEAMKNIGFSFSPEEWKAWMGYGDYECK
jgi:hypothetical protein